MAETLAGVIELGIQKGVGAALHIAENRTSERLSTIETKLQQIPQYNPRVEKSRGFPAAPDELTSIGTKLEEQDEERIRELGLPTSTFLQDILGEAGYADQNLLHQAAQEATAAGAKARPRSRLNFPIYSQGA